MNQCHLARVNAEQAAKAHVPGIGGHLAHAVNVFNVREHAIQRRRQLRQDAVQQNGVARLIKDALRSLGAAGQAQIQAQVQRTEAQTFNTAGCGNGRQFKQAPGAFDDRPHRLAACRRQFDLRSAFGLGQQDRHHAGLATA